jgi:hypothetical protein
MLSLALCFTTSHFPGLWRPPEPASKPGGASFFSNSEQALTWVPQTGLFMEAK